MNEHERTEKVNRLRAILEEAYDIAEELELGNIFYNEGFAEFFLAEDLGQTWNKKTQGPDGFSAEGHPTEYKMRSTPDGNFQFHWLSEKKMSRITEIEWVYFATRNRTRFTEVWRIPLENILPTLSESSVPQGGSGHRSYGLNELIDLGAVQVR